MLQADHEVTVQKCFIQISIFLCHKFPRIRKVTATKLFETLLVYDVIEDDEIKVNTNDIQFQEFFMNFFFFLNFQIHEFFLLLNKFFFLGSS